MISMMTTYLPQPLEPQMTVKGKRNSTHCSSSLGLKERTPRIARRLMLAMVLHYGMVGMVLVWYYRWMEIDWERAEKSMLCYAMVEPCAGRGVCLLAVDAVKIIKARVIPDREAGTKKK